MRLFWSAAILLCALPAAAAAGSSNALKTVAEIRRWSADNITGRVDFNLSGQVLSDTSFIYFIFKDETGYQAINPVKSDDGRSVGPGDIVSVAGSIYKPTHNWMDVKAKRIRIGSNAEIPPPVDIDAKKLFDSDMLYRFVRAEGVVIRATRDDLDEQYNWLTLRTESGMIQLAVLNTTLPLKKAEAMIDAEISASGFVRPFENLRKPLGFYIAIQPPGAITVDIPPPKDPFLPDKKSPRVRMHREAISGFVRAVSADSFYIRTWKDTCLQVKMRTRSSLPPVGQWIDASGFRNFENLQPQLLESLWRLQKRTESNEPVTAVELPQLFRFNVMSGDYVGKIVSLEGIVRLEPKTLGAEGFNLTREGHCVFVDISAFPDVAAKLQDQAVVNVTGLCLNEFKSDYSTDIFPSFSRAKIVLRQADDLKIIKNPPWWTTGRLMVLVAILCAAIAAIMAWNRALQRLSDIKSSRISYEKFARMAAQLKAEERRRLSVELHDSIAQNLTGIAMTVNTVRDIYKAGGAVEPQLLDIAVSALKSCREDIRNCLWELRNDALEAPTMDEAIRRTLAPHTRSARTHIRFNVPRSLFSDNSAHAVLYVIRELAINAVRHGQAKELRIAGIVENGKLLFSVQDNGCGFDCANIPGTETGHFGLQGVKERVASLGGELDVSSICGKGAKITVAVPLTKKES